nr:MAG TPA: Protein of unknown function (DUF1018) [Caudoviricetes sp.]
MASTITKKQVTLLQTAKTKLGLSEEDYRSLLYKYGVDSTKELKQPAFKHLLKTFQRLGFETQAQPMAAQLRHIAKMQDDMGISDAGLSSLCQKTVGKANLENPDECSKIIEALKAIKRRREAAASG